MEKITSYFRQSQNSKSQPYSSEETTNIPVKFHKNKTLILGKPQSHLPKQGALYVADSSLSASLPCPTKEMIIGPVMRQRNKTLILGDSKVKPSVVPSLLHQISAIQEKTNTLSAELHHMVTQITTSAATSAHKSTANKKTLKKFRRNQRQRAARKLGKKSSPVFN
jgi:hypothetical protein